jgi:hypothetical protein
MTRNKNERLQTKGLTLPEGRAMPGGEGFMIKGRGLKVLGRYRLRHCPPLGSNHRLSTTDTDIDSNCGQRQGGDASGLWKRWNS